MQPRMPAVFALSLVAHQFLIDRQYQEAVAYFKAQPKSLENHITLAFFLSLTNNRVAAKEEIETAIKLVGANKDEILISWGEFFDKYQQAELSFAVYQAATDSLLKERASIAKYFSTPRNENTDLIVRTAKAAIEAGDPQLAETYLSKLKTFQDRFANRSLWRLAAANYGRTFINKDLYAGLDDAGDTKSSYFNYGSIEDVLYETISKDTYFDFDHSELSKRIEAEKNPELYAKCLYFGYLFDSYRSHSRSKFAGILEAKNTPRVWRMLSGVALCQMGLHDPSNEYMGVEYSKPIFIAQYEQAYQKFRPETESIEENCVYLIATRIMHILTQDNKYQTEIKRCLNGNSRVALNVLLPFAIPFYLRIAFLEVILDSAYWVDNELTIAPEILAIMKVQYTAFVEEEPIYHGYLPPMGLNNITRINLAAQVISTTTNIGRIIKIPQGVNFTSLTSGTSLIFMEFLRKHAEKSYPDFCWFLLPSTIEALTLTCAFNFRTERLSALRNRFSELAKKLEAQVKIFPTNATSPDSLVLNLGHQELDKLKRDIDKMTKPTLSEIFKQASEFEERRLILEKYARQPSGLQTTRNQFEIENVFGFSDNNKMKYKKYNELVALSENPENNISLEKLFYLGIYHQRVGDNIAAKKFFYAAIIACAQLEKYGLHDENTQSIASLVHAKLAVMASAEGDPQTTLLECKLASESFPPSRTSELKVLMIKALVELNELTRAKELLAQLPKLHSLTLLAHLIIAKKDETHPTTDILDAAENILTDVKKFQQLLPATIKRLTAFLEQNKNFIRSIQKNYPFTAAFLKTYSPKPTFGLFDGAPERAAPLTNIPDAVKEDRERDYNLDL